MCPTEIDPRVSPLTSVERSTLHRQEATIARTKEHFFECGTALCIIRNQRLYRESHHTFEDYCRQRWSMSSSRARYLIAAAEIVDESVTEVTLSAGVELTERAVRPLVPLSPKQRVEAIKSAIKSLPVSGESTAKMPSKLVQQAVDNLSNNGTLSGPKDEKPTIHFDAMGYQIPVKLNEFWERRQELQDLATEVSRIKCRIEAAQKADDPLFRGIRNTILNELSGVHYQLLRFKPYIVCTDCQGHPNINKTPCRLCHGTGFIGKEGAEVHTAQEKLVMRQKAMELAKK